MKHDAFERNSALENRSKNPFVVRCDVILLKHAITKAENHIRKHDRFTLVNVENALHHIDIAHDIVCRMLQSEEFDCQAIYDVCAELNRAEGNTYVTPIREAFEMAIDLIADDPIPFRIVEADSPIGTIVSKKADYEPIVTWSDAALAHYNTHYNNMTHVTFKLECVGFNRYNPKFDNGVAVDLLIGAAIEMSALAVGDEARGCLKALRDYLSEHQVSFAVNYAAIKHLSNFYAPGVVSQMYWNGGAK